MGGNKHILSSQSNKPVQAITQDALLASYQMSNPDNIIDRQFMMQVLCALDRFPLEAHASRPQYPARTLFEYLLPDDFNYTKEEVVIKNGALIHGTLTKRHLGAVEGGIIHRLHLDYGYSRCTQFINELSRVATHWLLQRSFSVGIGDCVLASQEDEKLRLLLDSQLNKAGPASVLKAAAVEADLNRALNRSLARMPKNNLRDMVMAGSKGSQKNLTDILGALSQQSINGDLIPEQFDAPIDIA